MVVVWFGFGYLRFELWLSEARRKSRPLGRRAGFPFARRNEREKKPLARRARAREVHSLSLTAVGGGPTGFPLASPNARPPLPPPRAAFCETRPNFGCIVVKPRGAGALVRPRSSLRLIRGQSSAAGARWVQLRPIQREAGTFHPARAGHRARLVQDLANSLVGPRARR